MRWAAIRIETPAAASEAVCAALLDAGCQGVAEASAPSLALTGYLPVTDGIEATMSALQSRLEAFASCGLPSVGALTVTFVEDADWANAWRQFYQPTEIGRRLVIQPSWQPYRGTADRLVIEMDPGMAFGTGGHPTTRLCLVALEHLVSAGDVVADIGTGTGILAIAAALLGARAVHATDIDALPRRVAQENVERNRVGDRVTVHAFDGFYERLPPCDLAVANIIADAIIEIAPLVTRVLRPGGVFVACGIVEERLPEVVAALSAAGLSPAEIRSDDVWRLVIARKGARDVSVACAPPTMVL